MTDLREAVPTRVGRTRTQPPRFAPRGLPSPRERKRTLNRALRRSSSPDPETGFGCECARAGCSARLPLTVERHRRRPDRFIVTSAHVDGDVVVGVADRFAIVEQNGVNRSFVTGSVPKGYRKESQ